MCAAAADKVDNASTVRLIPQTRDELLKLYTTPGHPIAFSAPTSIYNYFKGKLALDFIQDALTYSDTYGLHREYKRPRVYNPYFAYIRRKNFQADLITVASLREANDNISYLNLIIDTFTRKIWVIPQKDKTAETTCDALKSWLETIEQDSHPNKQLLTDAGREYVNNKTKRLFLEYNVQHDITRNILKASIAERCNRSIQILIYKYLTEKGEERYIDALPALIRSYNNRVHRSLGLHSPNFADKRKNELLIRGLHARRYAERQRRKKKLRFRRGDKVRVKTYGTGISTVRRAYLQQFKGELFTVETINTTLPIPMYNIRSMDTDELIEGGFYAGELQKVSGDSFKIEKVLRRRGQGENEEYFVKWKYFGPRWNSWVKKSDFV